MRAAASLCVHLGARRRLRVLLPGERRPAEVASDLAAWPAVHARLALVEAGRRGRRWRRSAPRSGAVFWVTAAALGRRPRALGARRGRADPGRHRSRRRGARPLFTVAGCSGYRLGSGAPGAERRHERARAPRLRAARPRRAAARAAARPPAASAPRRAAGRVRRAGRLRGRRTGPPRRRPAGLRVLALVVFATGGGRRWRCSAGPRCRRRRARPLAARARGRDGLALGLVVTGPASCACCGRATGTSSVTGSTAGSPPCRPSAGPTPAPDDWVRLDDPARRPAAARPRRRARLLARPPPRRPLPARRWRSWSLLVALRHRGHRARPRRAAAARRWSLLVLVAAWLWLPRLGAARGRWPAAALVLAVGVAVAAASAAALDARAPVVGLPLLELVRRRGDVTFDWNHSYGPLDWPREGTTLLNVKSDRPPTGRPRPSTASTAAAGLARRRAATATARACPTRRAAGPGPRDRWDEHLRVTVRALAQRLRGRPPARRSRSRRRRGHDASRRHPRQLERAAGEGRHLHRARLRARTRPRRRCAAAPGTSPGSSYSRSALHRDRAAAPDGGRDPAPRGRVCVGSRRGRPARRRRSDDAAASCRRRPTPHVPARAAADRPARRRTYDAVRAVERYLERQLCLQRAAARAPATRSRRSCSGQDRLLPAVLRRDGADAAHGGHPGAGGRRLLARRRANRDTQRVPGPRPRRPLLGRGLLRGHRLGHVRPHARRPRPRRVPGRGLEPTSAAGGDAADARLAQADAALAARGGGAGGPADGGEAAGRRAGCCGRCSCSAGGRGARPGTPRPRADGAGLGASSPRRSSRELERALPRLGLRCPRHDPARPRAAAPPRGRARRRPATSAALRAHASPRARPTRRGPPPAGRCAATYGRARPARPAARVALRSRRAARALSERGFIRLSGNGLKQDA